MSVCVSIPGTPPRKNRRHVLVRRGARASMINSPDFLDFVELVRHAFLGVRFESGRLSITVIAAWPTARHLDVSVGRGDVDAPLSWVLDALQLAGVVDDDVRFVAAGCVKTHDPHRPRTVIQIAEVDDGDT